MNESCKKKIISNVYYELFEHLFISGRIEVQVHFHTAVGAVL